jgi:hypothetical protein
MRIAIILAGQPRFIENKYASASHKTWVEGHDVEFFGHYWNASSAALTSSWSGVSNLTLPGNAGNLIEDQYAGITVINQPPLYFEKSPTGFVGVPLSSVNLDGVPQDTINFSNTVSMMKSIHEAIMLANTRHTQNPFDIYVLSRWDLYIDELTRPEEICLKTISILNQYSHFGDNIFLGDPASINLVDAFPNLSEILEIITAYDHYSFSEFMFVGENIKYISAILRRSDFSPHKVPGKVEIIRSSNFKPGLNFLAKLKAEFLFLKRRYLEKPFH